MMGNVNNRLVIAAGEGKVDEIAALLDQGADINFAPLRLQETPLMRAIDSKHEAAALYLIERGAHVGLACEVGSTALHWACGKGMERVVRELLKRGAPVEAQNRSSERALHYATESGHESIIRLLVTEYGAQVDCRDRWGTTPLLLALDRGEEGVATFLASAGANCYTIDSMNWTTLHCACYRGLASIATRLLDEFGLDLHAKTTGGESCLHLAAESGSAKTCRVLVERGAPVDVLDEKGRSPLFAAVLPGRPDALKFLLDADVDIERRDVNGWSPLALASKRGGKNSWIKVLMLIERGARLDGPLPMHFRSPSLDATLTWVLSESFYEMRDPNLLPLLFNKPEEPIPVYRKTLRWALTLPSVVALLEKQKWSLVGAAKTDDEAWEMRKKRLSMLRDDAWERRKHLVIGRALDWGYGDSSKVPLLKKPKLDEKTQKHNEPNAGAGKA